MDTEAIKVTPQQQTTCMRWVEGHAGQLCASVSGKGSGLRIMMDSVCARVGAHSVSCHRSAHTCTRQRYKRLDCQCFLSLWRDKTDQAAFIHDFCRRSWILYANIIADDRDFGFIFKGFTCVCFWSRFQSCSHVNKGFLYLNQALTPASESGLCFITVRAKHCFLFYPFSLFSSFVYLV